MVSEISAVNRWLKIFWGPKGSNRSRILILIVPEISVDRDRRHFCGTLSQKFLWIFVPEISVERCRRNFCGSLSQKFLWNVVPDISVDPWLREISAEESLSQKFLRVSHCQRNFFD